MFFEAISMKTLQKLLHALTLVEVAALALCSTVLFLTFAFVITYHELQVLWSLVF